MNNLLVKAMIAEVCSAYLLADFYNKSVNHICGTINDSLSVWHSHLCHVNFGLMSHLSSLSLILYFTIAKGSKCHSCVQSKQSQNLTRQ
jgi:hypothetical protein